MVVGVWSVFFRNGGPEIPAIHAQVNGLTLTYTSTKDVRAHVTRENGGDKAATGRRE